MGPKKQVRKKTGPDDDVDYLPILRANYDRIARAREGGKHNVRVAQAEFEASMRGDHHRQLQTCIKDLKSFELQKQATLAQFIQCLLSRSEYSRKVRSLAVPHSKVGPPLESSSSVTPPDWVDLFHLIEIMEGTESVLQLLFEQSSGYFQGFRPTPTPTRTKRYEKNGFFIFSNVELPEFFGSFHRMPRSSDYTCGEKVLIGENFLGLMTEQMVEITPTTVRSLLGYVLETPMIAFGEGQRLYNIQAYIAENWDAVLEFLTPELRFYYGNWSYLSKLALNIYLAIVEVVVGFHGSHKTVRKAWRLMRYAMEQFQRNGFQLVLTNEHGDFCLSRLIGSSGLLRLLKCEIGVVGKIIIRLSQNSLAEFKETRANSKGSSSRSISADSESDTEDEQDGDDDAEVATAPIEDEDSERDRLFNEFADEEFKRWNRILAEGGDLVEQLMRS